MFEVALMTREDAENLMKKTKTAVLPVGSLEQHGPHLPLGTDSLDAYRLAREAIESMRGEKLPLLPPINYGVSYHHMSFSGTVSLSPETLIKIIEEIASSLQKHGIIKIVIINGHGGNTPALICASQKIRYEMDVTVFVESGETFAEERKKIFISPWDVHSGDYETSTSIYLRRKYVKMEKRIHGETKCIFGKVPWGYKVEELSESGVLGDSKCATVEKGEKIWKLMVGNLSEFLEKVRDWRR